MKFTINLDCTPEEARAFVGLPNIAPVQDRMMKALEDKMYDNIRNLDPESFMKIWLPATVQNWGELQKIFWAQMGQMGMPTGVNDEKPSDKPEKTARK